MFLENLFQIRLKFRYLRNIEFPETLYLVVWMVSKSVFEAEADLVEVRLQVKVIINLYLTKLSNVVWP